MRREQPRWDRTRIVRIHSQRCGINDKIDIRQLCTQSPFVPRYRFEARRRTKHARSGKVRPQLLRKRLCFFAGAVDEDEAFAILERALPGNCMARPAAGADKHYPQIAHIDREFAADSLQEPTAISI